MKHPVEGHFIVMIVYYVLTDEEVNALIEYLKNLK